MAPLASKALESFGAAADCIETFFRARGRTVRGSLVRVVELLRQANDNFVASEAGVEPARPLRFRKTPTESMPDEQIVMLAEGQLVAAALLHFSTHEGCEIDDTLLTRELCSAAGDLRWLDGAKTIVLGYRLHAAGGGRIRLFGNQEAGRDILWHPAGGCSVSIECKNREWNALWNQPQKWRHWALSRLKDMRTGLIRHPPLRLAFVHIPATPTLGASIQAEAEGVLTEVRENEAFLGGLSGFGLVPSAYALTEFGQPMLVNQAAFVEFQNPARIIPPDESRTRSLIAQVFASSS